MDPITSAEQWLGHEASLEFGDGDATALKAEYDRMLAELAKTVADCGVCKLGGRTIHINDKCPEHGDRDEESW